MTDQRERKLIEVAIPLEEINAACKADKDRKTGTIRNLHKWFAPMPLPAWRALLFAALIDDPNDEEARASLLDLIKRLVNTGADAPDERVLDEARRAIADQFPNGPPPVLDPFCGGGSTLVEAQRLGLRSAGSDLNPVPVLITRTLTEVLPAVHHQQPLHPDSSEDSGLLLYRSRSYAGYEGLTTDVLHYAERVNERARALLAAHYPERPGERAIAWLWARTAKCTNPACGVETVLTTSWWLSKRRGAMAWIQPRVCDGRVELDVVTEASTGGPKDAPKVGRGANFTCLACDGLLTEDSLIAQARNGGLGLRMTAVASEVEKRRVFRGPTQREMLLAEEVPSVDDLQDIRLADIPRWFSGPRFGLNFQSDLYTKRQLFTLATFADLVRATYDEVLGHGGSPDWASAVTTVLGIGVGKLAHYGSSQTRMELATGTSNGGTHPAFGRNDMPMTWDFAETNPFGGRSGGWMHYLGTSLRAIGHAPHGKGTVVRGDARAATAGAPCLVATDPPYFDAIGYADLSDYFYLWHRRTLRNVHPDLYATVAAPREGELTAVPAHHENSPQKARDYFVTGFTETFLNLVAQSLPGLPLVVVYASKEQKAGLDEETRWESILSAMVAAGLEITGTWPIHGTGSSRMISLGTNSVATYVAMIARPRDPAANVVSLGDFSRFLRKELGPAIRALQGASILPVDMGQAVLGPGMSIFSRHAMVTDQSGERVSVAHAIRLINTVARELQEEQEGELVRAHTVAAQRMGGELVRYGEPDCATQGNLGRRGCPCRRRDQPCEQGYTAGPFRPRSRLDTGRRLVPHCLGRCPPPHRPSHRRGRRDRCRRPAARGPGGRHG